MIAKIFRFILSACFFAILAGMLGLAAGLSMARAPGPLTEPKLIEIERGLGTRGVAAKLEQMGVIHNRYAFMFAALLGGDVARLQAGEYEFLPRASSFTILNQMAEGQVHHRKLTIPEGLSVAEILTLVQAADTLKGEMPKTTYPEGTLLPETYLYTKGETREELVKRMQNAMDQALEKLWSARAPDFPLKSKQEVVIFASIVEKETGVPAERPRVASVFFNRLQTGMKLQSDPTVIYALTKGQKPLGRLLTTKDLEETNSPYNTYRYEGLPPGPIANPGIASLQAVFAPEKTDYLYFVADGTGGHAFAKSLDDHNANVARWRARANEDRP